MILDFLQSGYLDCLHTYGDFSHYGGFRREMAVKAVRYLQDKGIQINVWTNHGDNHNFQSIDDSWSRTRRVSILNTTHPSLPDLWGGKEHFNPHPEGWQRGIERLGLGDLEQWQSANGDSFESVEYHMDLTRTLGITFLCRSRDVTQFWGQDRSLRLKEVLSLNRMSDPINYLRWVYHQLRPGLKSFISNSLLEGINVRDGNSLHAFKRYGRCQQGPIR